MNNPHKSEPDQLLDELDIHMTVLVIAVVKELARMNGTHAGMMPCPRCKTGTLRWFVGPTNGHAAAMCDRVVAQVDGRAVHCINAME